MTLNGVVAVILRYSTKIKQLWGLITLKWLKIDPYSLQ